MVRKRLSLVVPIAFTLCVSAVTAAAQQTHPWTIQEIFGGADLTGESPEEIHWAPDSRQVTYLDEAGNLLEFEVGGATARKVIGSDKLAPLLDAPISEQDRDHRNRYDEPQYIWAPDSRSVLFDTNGQLWLFDVNQGTGHQVGDTGMQSGDDPKFAPNGHSISFLRNHNLYVQPLEGGGQATALTHTTSDTVLNGGIDWVYLEELDVRSNYFWSPDSKQLAFLQMDEQKVPLYPIEDWIPDHAKVQEQRYPQPGDPNPAVRVGVVNASGGETRWLNVPLHAWDDYIPRFGWVNSHVVWVETLDRAQKHENIYFADTNTGQVKLALAQTEPKYFNTTYDVTFIGGHQFLLLSWRDGHTHIYRYSYDAADPLGSEAQLENEVERGPYEVTVIKSVDETTGTIYYLSNENDPRERQVWAVKLDGSGKHQVTQVAGVHDPNFPEHGSWFTDKYSNRSTPPTVAFCSGAGVCHPFWNSTPVVGHDLHPAEQLELKAADGKTTLYGSLLLPQGMDARASVPLIVNPYGGPDVGEVTNRWAGRSLYFDELLAEHGFAVLHVDNRGMGARGRAFEQVAYHNFGPPELADQLAAVDQVLAKYPQLDPKRLGWWGWSWGGTFTLYALSHSDRFRVGMSGAPVTDWRNYDSIYTERYMGLPSQDAANYAADSVQNSAATLKGHLLIMHGTGDDNVHFANTIQYIQKLIDAGISYDYNVFPRKTHSVAGPKAQTELHQRLLEEFELYLKPAAEVAQQ